MNMKLTWQQQYDFEIGELITTARHHKGLTQKQLAQKCGMKQSAIARLERGSYLPSHITLKRIAQAVNMKLLAPRLTK